MSRTRAALGLGLAALGRPGYINVGHARDLEGAREPEALERRCHAVLDRAWELGFRHVDAARSYGRAEEFLAHWLAKRGRTPDDLFVSTKWGYTYTADWRADAVAHEIKDHGASTFRRQWKESSALLGPHIDLYQIHSATLDSGVLADRDVHAELGLLRDSGVPVGLSVSGTGQAAAIDLALTLVVAGRPLFSSVQATWNLLERSAEPALVRAHAAGLRVIIKEALANGRLPDPVLALTAALTRPWASLVLSGASTIAQLEEGAGARDAEWDEATLSRVPDCEPGSYWAERSKMPWT